MTPAETIRLVVAELQSVFSGHLDNTGATCRVDLNGHDCCYVCNFAQDVLEAYANYRDDP